jgi:hypothetical protein
MSRSLFLSCSADFTMKCALASLIPVIAAKDGQGGVERGCHAGITACETCDVPVLALCRFERSA